MYDEANVEVGRRDSVRASLGSQIGFKNHETHARESQKTSK